MKSMEQPKPYTAKKAETEGLKMQKKIKMGEAENYTEAEKIIENEAKVKNIQESLMHPKVKRWASGREESKKDPSTLMRVWVDYETIDECREEINEGTNALIVGGEISYCVQDHLGYISEAKLEKFKKHIEEDGEDSEVLDKYNDETGEYEGKYENFDELKNYYIERKLVIPKDADSEVIGEMFDRKIPNAIRISPFDQSRNAVSQEVIQKIEVALESGEKILDILHNLESQKLIKICNIPNFYTDKEALKDRYELEFSTRKELDKFLESELGKSAKPERVLERAKYLDGDTIKFLLEKYQDKIDLTKVVSFGSGGIVQNLERNDKMEILEKVVSILEKRTDENIERVERRRESWMKESWVTRGTFGPGLTDESDMNLKSRLNFLSSAATQGLILPDYKERIKKINSVIDYIPSGYYVDRVISRMRKDIEDVALLLEKLSNEKKIKGKGLEFVNSEYTQGRQVYLDGELVGSFDNAEFGEKPTNGEVVAWVTHEVIDRNNITGTQNRDIVYAWKKGVGTKEVFEDHAWSNERYLRVSAPEVDSDGTVKIKITSGDKTEQKEFKV